MSYREPFHPDSDKPFNSLALLLCVVVLMMLAEAGVPWLADRMPW